MPALTRMGSDDVRADGPNRRGPEQSIPLLAYLHDEEDFGYRMPITEPGSSAEKRIEDHKARVQEKLGSLAPASSGNEMEKKIPAAAEGGEADVSPTS